MRLAIDAMGNDDGPQRIVDGVAAFLRQDPEMTVILVGNQELLAAPLAAAGLAPGARVEVVHASQTMEMDDKVSALREKRDSSIVRLVGEVKAGRADAMVALGNTAAAVGATSMGLRNLEGVHRPGIALPLPTRNGGLCVLIDMGANTIAKPRHLLDYGVMASIYSELLLHVKNPRVGLLNVGGEAGKGNAALREAFELLQQAPINFIGNVEGGDLYAGTCDVVVCDGLIGNIVLKVSEELAATIVSWLQEAFASSWLTKLGALFSRQAFSFMRQRISYAAYGGAPLLGVNGICIIGHGRSNAAAVANALRIAKESVALGLNERIRERLAGLRQQPVEEAGDEVESFKQ